jgi:type I restriction enzyme S subunit
LWGLQPYLLSLIERSTHGTCKIQTDKLLNVKIRIPSISEQERIMTKVDELFALCDQLAGQVTAAETSREQLLTAVLAQAG